MNREAIARTLRPDERRSSAAHEDAVGEGRDERTRAPRSRGLRRLRRRHAALPGRSGRPFLPHRAAELLFSPADGAEVSATKCCLLRPSWPALEREIEAREEQHGAKRATRRACSTPGARESATRYVKRRTSSPPPWLRESDERVASEAADVVYHLLVGLRSRGLRCAPCSTCSRGARERAATRKRRRAKRARSA